MIIKLDIQIMQTMEIKKKRVWDILISKFAFIDKGISPFLWVTIGLIYGI